jgi:hypothetical protein
MKKDESKAIISSEQIEQVIYFIRGQKVILDQDLAVLYGVSTGNFNKAISRNQKRFPEDFAFRLTKEEWDRLIFQIGISKKGRGGRRKLPTVFTEHGVAMAELAELKSYVLKSFHKNDREFKRVWDAIDKLINPPAIEEPRRIGFNLGQ